MIQYILIPILIMQSSFLYSQRHRHKKVEPHLNVAMNTPATFGKTHFIVGHPLHEASPDTTTRSSTPAPSSTTQVFFTPDNNVKKKLLQLIKQEMETIRIAVFIMTEPDIAKELLKARKRGIPIELITDAGCLKERSNKINLLCDQGCTVYIYNPSYSKPNTPSIMHHKFALFTNNNGKSLVWTGSYNFTKMASKTNQENALVLDDQKTFETFSNQFQRLKGRSYRYGRGRNIIQSSL